MPRLARRGCRPRCRARLSGQALVEFALVVPVLVALVMSIIDLGWWYQDEVSVDTIVRSGARYASLHPTAWSNAPSAAANSIQGVLQAEGGGLTIANTDTSIGILYYANPGGSPVLCGKYTVAGGGMWIPINGYTQSNCQMAGALIEVDVAYTYRLQAPSPDLPVQSTIIKKCTVVEVV